MSTTSRCSCSKHLLNTFLPLLWGHFGTGRQVPFLSLHLGIILLVPKEELAGVSLQVLILGPLSVSALWVRKHPKSTKCRDGWRASVLYLNSLGYCCRFCAKPIKDYKQSGRVVLKGHEMVSTAQVYLFYFVVNALWPSDAIWQHRTESKLVQVMAFCLAAPIHYLNQCLLLINEVLWHSPQTNFTAMKMKKRKIVRVLFCIMYLKMILQDYLWVGVGVFLRWWSPSTMWASPFIFNSLALGNLSYQEI